MLPIPTPTTVNQIPSVPSTIDQVYSINISAQFEGTNKAVEFIQFIAAQMQNFYEI